jgi:hypothetical protein
MLTDQVAGFINYFRRFADTKPCSMRWNAAGAIAK